MLIDIIKILNTLSQRRRVFVSEADFQLELAWTIKEIYPSVDIRLEFCPAFNRKMHIDILVVMDGKWIPIELKYKTKGCELTDNGEHFILKNHGAKDIGCYSYLHDIQRIEQIKHKTPLFAEGYAIMLTNELSYTNPPAKTNCYYRDFSIENGALKKETLEWDDNTSQGTKKGIEAPITLKGEYIMQWQRYSVIDNTANGVFQYLVNRIE